MSDQLYKEACQRERLEDCERLVKQLDCVGWENLSPHGRGVCEALRWATGECDEPPYPIGGDDE